MLVDTPGVHKPDSSLGRKMMVEVREALEGCDLILLIVDATRKFGAERSDRAWRWSSSRGTPVFLLLNKIDLLKGKKTSCCRLSTTIRSCTTFQEIIPISARKPEGLDILLEKVIGALAEGPALFPDDQVTDQPVRFMVAEIIREQY